jgi:hypothetical protein
LRPAIWLQQRRHPAIQASALGRSSSSSGSGSGNGSGWMPIANVSTAGNSRKASSRGSRSAAAATSEERSGPRNACRKGTRKAAAASTVPNSAVQDGDGAEAGQQPVQVARRDRRQRDGETDQAIGTEQGIAGLRCPVHFVHRITTKVAITISIR